MHPGETISNPQLTDWQSVIDSSVGKKEFIVKNDLASAVATEQKIYTEEIMGNVGTPDNVSPSTSAKEIVNEINSIMKGLSQEARNEKKKTLTEASLPASPTLIGKLTDTETLTKILNIIKA